MTLIIMLFCFFLNKCWICIIKGVKMLFLKCYQNVLSYKFDRCNRYKDDILFTDASFWNTFRNSEIQYTSSAGWGSNSWTVRASGEVLKWFRDETLRMAYYQCKHVQKLRPNLCPWTQGFMIHHSHLGSLPSCSCHLFSWSHKRPQKDPKKQVCANRMGVPC